MPLCSRIMLCRAQAVQSGAAAESLLFRPALSDALAPELYAPMRAAMGNAPTGMPPPPPRKRPAAEDAAQQVWVFDCTIQMWYRQI